MYQFQMSDGLFASKCPNYPTLLKKRPISAPSKKNFPFHNAIRRSHLSCSSQFQTCSNRNALLAHHLAVFQLHLDEMVKDKTFLQISKNERKISQRFIFFLEFLKKNKDYSRNIFSDLEKAAKQIKTVIKSVAHPHCQYNFLHFARSLKQYEKFTESKSIALEPKSVIERQAKNEACSYHQVLRQSSIKDNDIQWSASTKGRSALTKLQQHKLLLPNLCCIACSSYLIKNKQIVKSNPLFAHTIALSKKEAETETLFSKNVCGIVNSGGGIIVIGAEETQKGIKVTGMSLGEMAEIEAKIKLMQALISKIDKEIRFQIQKSLVVQEWDEGASLPSFCYKILIYPLIKKEMRYTCYIESIKAHQPTQYEIYEIKKGKAQLCQSQQKVQNTYYNLMHSNYEQNSNKWQNHHQSIVCANSCTQFFYHYLQNASNPTLFEQGLEGQELKGQEQMREILGDDERQCEMRYSRQCLLLVGVQRQKKLIQQLNSLLRSKKCVFEISKPYDGHFQQKGRAVYLICHSQKHEFIKSLINESDKSGGITMIPVFTTLRVDKSSKVMSSRHVFIDYIYHRFAKVPFERQDSQKDAFLYSFDDKRQAIYAYMIFEHILNVRPYFVKASAANPDKNRKIND